MIGTGRFRLKSSDEGKNRVYMGFGEDSFKTCNYYRLGRDLEQ